MDTFKLVYGACAWKGSTVQLEYRTQVSVQVQMKVNRHVEETVEVEM